MGMFDSVYVRCPHCGENVELQSKAGECLLHEYELDEAPLEVLLSIAKEPLHRCKCGGRFKLTVTVSHFSRIVPL